MNVIQNLIVFQHLWCDGLVFSELSNVFEMWTGLDWSCWIGSLPFLPISILSSTLGSLGLTHTLCATLCLET